MKIFVLFVGLLGLVGCLPEFPPSVDVDAATDASKPSTDVGVSEGGNDGSSEGDIDALDPPEPDAALIADAALDPDAAPVPIDADEDGYTADHDCNDHNPAIYPGALEVCNNADDDCDGEIDEGVQIPFYPDRDRDGHGDANAPAVNACSVPFNHAVSNDDCDDNEPLVRPGLPEVCGDGLDNDCNGSDAVCVPNDADGDGSPDEEDCDDNNAAIYPDALEVCNTADDDCDGEIDEGVQRAYYPDRDRDGHGDANAPAVNACSVPFNHAVSNDDCDDTNLEVRPGRGEICGNGLDDDCNGGDMVCQPIDNDGDGWAVPADCNDNNPVISPGAIEVCNGRDDDCDGGIDEGVQHAYYDDVDGDGYGDIRALPVMGCDPPEGMVESSDDCDDNDPRIHPDLDGICGNGFDNGCNGEDVPCVPVDDDDDGWVVPQDCNDRNPSIYPGAIELCNGLDDDCDGGIDEDLQFLFYPDLDSDGHGDANAPVVAACAAPLNHVVSHDDCDDNEPLVHPGLSEICGDGLDNDCDGRADLIDFVCADLSDTIVTIETQGPRPAMLLEVATYTHASDLGRGWQESAEVVNEAVVALTLPAQRYPSNAFCGIRFNVTFWNDPEDVNAQGAIVGQPNQKLCEVRAGVPTIDMGMRRVLVQLGEDFYDVNNLVGVQIEDEPGCSALLILSNEGPCALD